MKFNKFGIAFVLKEKTRMYHGLFSSITPAEMAIMYKSNIDSEMRRRGIEIQ